MFDLQQYENSITAVIQGLLGACCAQAVKSSRCRQNAVCHQQADLSAATCCTTTVHVVVSAILERPMQKAMLERRMHGGSKAGGTSSLRFCHT